MTVGELRQKVKAAGGKISEEGWYVEFKEDEDVDFHTEDGDLVMYVSKVQVDDSKLDRAVGITGGLQFFEVAIKMAAWLGSPVKGSTIEVVKEVKLEDTEKFVLQGKVDAYEKIIIGRELTVSK